MAALRSTGRDVASSNGDGILTKTDETSKDTSDLGSGFKDPSKDAETPAEHYELSPLMEKALQLELDTLMTKIWKIFPEVAANDAERIVIDRYKNKGGEDLRHTLGLNVAKRILNVHNPFYVKMKFAEMPRGRQISGFVRKYNVTKFERVWGKKSSFTGSVANFRDFDRLCKIKQTEYDGVKVQISSFYRFTKCPVQLKFKGFDNKLNESRENKNADLSHSASESVNRNDEKKNPKGDASKDINIVIEIKVEKDKNGKEGEKVVQSVENIPKIKLEQADNKPKSVEINKEYGKESVAKKVEVAIKKEKLSENEIDKDQNSTTKSVTPKTKALQIKVEKQGNKPVQDNTEHKEEVAKKVEDSIKKETPLEKEIVKEKNSTNKSITPKENVDQIVSEDKAFEDILKHSIVLDECIASDED